MVYCLPAPDFRALMVLLAATLFVTGCGSGLPKVYTVKGKVVMKGQGPAKGLAGYNVQFQGIDDPAELPGGAIDEDGAFTLYTRVGGKVIPGVKAGTYKVCLLPPPVEGGPPPPLRIPARYTKFETSKLEYTIAPEQNEITIELEKAAR